MKSTGVINLLPSLPHPVTLLPFGSSGPASRSSYGAFSMFTWVIHSYHCLSTKYTCLIFLSSHWAVVKALKGCELWISASVTAKIRKRGPRVPPWRTTQLPAEGQGTPVMVLKCSPVKRAHIKPNLMAVLTRSNKHCLLIHPSWRSKITIDVSCPWTTGLSLK